MAIEDEFATVDLLLQSDAECRGVDAFALSLIKIERQMRRLCTFLVFQSDAFSRDHAHQLKQELAGRRLYFRHLVAAWDDLCKLPLADLVGAKFEQLIGRIEVATAHRNKIFHGQLTGDSLSRADLLALVSDMKDWCSALGGSAHDEFGYDGMDRRLSWGSFRKSSRQGIGKKLARRFASVTEYATFLKELENRPNISLHPTAPSGRGK